MYGNLDCLGKLSIGDQSAPGFCIWNYCPIASVVEVVYAVASVLSVVDDDVDADFPDVAENDKREW